MSCQNHNLPRKDQMFYLPDREIAERSPDSLVGSRRRGRIHRGPPGRSVLPAAATRAFNPATVTPSDTPATTQLTISASSQSAALRGNSHTFFPLTALASFLCLFGVRKRHTLKFLLLMGWLWQGSDRSSAAEAVAAAVGVSRHRHKYPQQ